MLCHHSGNVIVCSGMCGKKYHKHCLNDNTMDMDATWYCNDCKKYNLFI